MATTPASPKPDAREETIDVWGSDDEDFEVLLDSASSTNNTSATATETETDAANKTHVERKHDSEARNQVDTETGQDQGAEGPSNPRSRPRSSVNPAPRRVQRPLEPRLSGTRPLSDYAQVRPEPPIFTPRHRQGRFDQGDGPDGPHHGIGHGNGPSQGPGPGPGGRFRPHHAQGYDGGHGPGYFDRELEAYWALPRVQGVRGLQEGFARGLFPLGFPPPMGMPPSLRDPSLFHDLLFADLIDPLVAMPSLGFSMLCYESMLNFQQQLREDLALTQQRATNLEQMLKNVNLWVAHQQRL